MYYFWLIALTLFCSLPLQAQGIRESCKSLANSIEISFGSPGIVAAGTLLKLRVKVKVTDQTLLAPFPRVPVSFFMSNELLGSKKYQQALMIKTTSASGIEVKEDFDIELPFGENTFGHYQASAGFGFQVESDFCFAEINNVVKDPIVIINTPEAIDINAPIITSTTTSKKTYGVGETMMVDLDVIDKSVLCTEELHEQKICNAVWHMSLVEVESGRGVHIFPPIKSVGANKYAISVELTAKDAQNESLFTPGKYRVLGINVADKWGNGIHDLAKQAQLEFVVEQK